MKIQYNEDGTPFVMWGENKIEMENGPLGKYYTDKAERELRETPEIVETALKELRELLKGEKNLVVPLDDAHFLMKFLRPCKFYVVSAFKKIQAFYKFHLNHKEHCDNLQPENVKSAFDHNIVSILSPRDQHGRRILLCDSEHWVPREVPIKDLFRGVQLGLEAAMTESPTQICGNITILDMKGLSLTQVMQFTPSFAKMLVDWVQDCAPIRIKAVHIVNQPYVFNMVFAVFKPFLREKLRSRIYFHGSNRQSLLAHIDAKALRKRHGGTLPEPEISGELQWQMMHHYEKNFEVASSYGYRQ